MHRLCLLRALPFFTPNQEQMWGHPEQEEPAPHCRTHLQEPQPQIHVPAEGQHLCRAAWGERASLFPACPSTFPPIFTRTQPSLPSIPISTPLSSQPEDSSCSAAASSASSLCCSKLVISHPLSLCMVLEALPRQGWTGDTNTATRPAPSSPAPGELCRASPSCPTGVQAGNPAGAKEIQQELRPKLPSLLLPSLPFHQLPQHTATRLAGGWQGGSKGGAAGRENFLPGSLTTYLPSP